MEQQVLNIPMKKVEAVPDALIYRCTDIFAALRLEVDTSGFERKQIAMELGIPESNFSDMLTGKRNLPLDKKRQLQRMCGNNVLLKWEAYDDGFEIRPMQSALEKQVTELKRDLEAATRLLKNMINEKGVVQ